MTNILLEKKGLIAVATINRPKALNALNSEVLTDLDELVSAVKADADIRALVITGSGEKAFVAGADIGEMSTLTKEGGEAFGKHGNNVFRAIETLPIPTIAAVNGPGFHTEIALLCDMTLCTDDVVFQDGHFSLGFVPGDGQLVTLQELIGAKRAAHMVYTGENIDAKTALAWGMINEVVPKDKLMARALELAEKIMKQTRATRCMTHHLLTRDWKRRLINDFQFHITQEGFASLIDRPQHDLNKLREKWEEE